MECDHRRLKEHGATVDRLYWSSLCPYLRSSNINSILDSELNTLDLFIKILPAGTTTMALRMHKPWQILSLGVFSS